MLYGVFPWNFIETRKIETKMQKDRQIYIDMPTTWYPGCSWPNESNLKCWICDEIPSGPPRFIPAEYCMINGRESSGVLGHFDSWICAALYIKQNFPVEKRADMMQALCIVESSFSGKRKLIIPECVPKTRLKEYCGNSGLTRTARDALNDNLIKGLSL